ncbi:MAG: proline--tRNA ligase [Burkholderiales bacterium]|nr:proline--tRNA ligase [Burkholderiales bacterium]
MRTSRFFISTLKEAPSEAELVSHRLMLRAGLIKRLASGLYTWMPIGLKVLRKVEAIVREEMNASGALELLMPAVQPAELWQESERWDFYGAELLRLKDRHQRDFCFGPTHEEVITDVVRREVKSYKQLPINFYQIQTKFRDEIRPRFGVMRAREFVMKDAYSFHADFASLEATYRIMFETYGRIFTRLGLEFRAVAADTGSIGGTGSHEFHVLADSGEDAIAFCPDSDYAANVELAEALSPTERREASRMDMQKLATPGAKSMDEVSAFLGVPAQTVVKSLLVMTGAGNPCLLLLRGDHQLNEIKVAKILEGWRFATEDEVEAYMGCRPGYIGPVGSKVTVIADRSVMAMSDFVCGANENGFHLAGVNFGRDLVEAERVEDIRNVVAGDASPDGKGFLEICRGIEVGHIFQLRTKYSESLKAAFLDESGQSRIMEMGCYGIGVSRIVAAAIEQNNDEKGIVFPDAIAPFRIAIVPIGMNKSAVVKDAVEKLYFALLMAGVDVLLDDRDERPGVMFADMELIGIPHRVVVGERGLKEGNIEYQGRGDPAARSIALDEAKAFLENICAS